jgi:hypothetical protein
MAHAMHAHGSGQPRVVHLNTHHAVLYDNRTPFSIDGLAIRQKAHTSLDCTYLALGFGDGQAEPIADQRTRHCVPKLSNILVRVVENCAMAGESSERCVYELVLGIGGRVIRSRMLVSTRHDAIAI